MTHRYLTPVFMGLLFAAGGEAALVERTITYQAGDTACQGFLAYDDATTEKRPGVLVIHEYWGLNEYAKMRTRQLAEMGYVGFAADMYGGGKVAGSRQEAGQLAGQVRGTPLMRSRAVAALETLTAQPQVDPERLGAIGFCFGGTGVLQLAYTGADLDAAVSFHGGLVPPQAEDMERIKANILILHGAADPHVKKEAIDATLAGLDEAGADWQFVAYSGAVHAFTNPDAGDDPTTGAAYQERAAERSWAAMQRFLAEMFET